MGYMNTFNIIIITLILGFGVLIYLAANQSAEERIVDADGVLEVQADDQVVGNPESPVVLVEYLDFECPACRAYHAVVAELATQYGEEIAIVTRHFPLPFHQNGQPAAWAAEAAAKQGQFKEMADLIFAKQDDWSGKAANVSLFYPYAEELGLDIDQFQEDALSEEVKDKVDRHLAGGRAVGVNSTPTFFLQGEKISNPRTLEDFLALIDEALAEVEQTEEEVVTAVSDEEGTDEQNTDVSLEEVPSLPQ